MASIVTFFGRFNVFIANVCKSPTTGPIISFGHLVNE
jgi:hypothetical protein